MNVLTEQRAEFIREHIRLRCKNATQAAINVGYSPKTAASQASQILKDTKVQEYLKEQKSLLEKELRDEFFFDALEARKVMHDIMTNPDAEDRDKISVCKDFLDRAGFKPTDKIDADIDMDLNITVDYGDNE